MTESTSPRQTLSYLRGLLQSYGLEPKSKLGQNFLIDLNLLDLVVRTAELTKEDSVLEVGTGTGSLTAKLADAAGCVFTVEVDRDIQSSTISVHVREGAVPGADTTGTSSPNKRRRPSGTFGRSTTASRT